MDYVYAASSVSFGFFTRERFSDYWNPIHTYFNDWEKVKKTLVKRAKNDPFKSEYTWVNLVNDKFVPDA
jgi:hypothetical protein